MAASSWPRAVAFGALLLAGVGARAALAPAGGAREITVWAIEGSKVYHCPSSRWYGEGAGKPMPECTAIREGYRPAFGAPCGSACPPR